MYAPDVIYFFTFKFIFMSHIKFYSFVRYSPSGFHLIIDLKVVCLVPCI